MMERRRTRCASCTTGNVEAEPPKKKKVRESDIGQRALDPFLLDLRPSTFLFILLLPLPPSSTHSAGNHVDTQSSSEAAYSHLVTSIGATHHQSHLLVLTLYCHPKRYWEKIPYGWTSTVPKVGKRRKPISITYSKCLVAL